MSNMTPYTRKLHQALLAIGHLVEGNQHLPVDRELGRWDVGCGMWDVENL